MQNYNTVLVSGVMLRFIYFVTFVWVLFALRSCSTTNRAFCTEPTQVISGSLEPPEMKSSSLNSVRGFVLGDGLVQCGLDAIVDDRVHN